MNKLELLGYLRRLDKELQQPATIYIYGSAALILLDEPGRTSLDMDVAGPYSQVDFGAFREAAERAGFPVNPDEIFQQDHIEWVAALRLCLPKPTPQTELHLWQGTHLTVKTLGAAQLIASKLIRYDEIDQSDIRYLWTLSRVTIQAIDAATRELPPPFNTDALVVENLDNLRTDLSIWEKA